MLNVSTFQGRLAQDLAVENTPTGIAFCRLKVAVDRDYVSDGVRKTDFLSCICWREIALFAAKYFQKGDAVIVRGRLEEDVWKDKDGNTRSRMIVNVDNLYFGETKKAREDRSRRASDNPDALPPEEYEDITDEEAAQLPF